MKIRSITFFHDPTRNEATDQRELPGQFARAAAACFADTDIPVQTTRLATTPFAHWLKSAGERSAIATALAMEESAIQDGFSYLSLGPALPAFPKSYELVVPILAATNTVFLGGVMGSKRSGLSLPAVRACAGIIRQASRITSDGFANLRFAALANVSAGAPFFPAAYHAGNEPAFALALEAADLAVTAFENAESIADARRRLLEALEDNACLLTRIAEGLASRFSIRFGGVDISLAPYPQQWCSLGAALEALGVKALGTAGSLAAAAILADTLDRGRWLRAGFNGLMLPVLEDSILAERAAGGTLTLKDLLLYSAVCGTGLDTIPLPGDASADEITPLLMDLAALALRLNKPLTTRLMPIPGKSAGDPTGFTFEYFANSRVMALPSAPLHGLLAGDEVVEIQPRGRRNARRESMPAAE